MPERPVLVDIALLPRLNAAYILIKPLLFERPETFSLLTASELHSVVTR